MEEVTIAFAHYRNGEFLGFRADSFGSLTKKWAKLYTYTQHQVDIVLGGVAPLNDSQPFDFGEKLRELGADPNICKEITDREVTNHDQSLTTKAFEIRVIKVTDPELASGKYPTRDVMEEWAKHVNDYEVMEVHDFTIKGKLIK